MEFIGWIFDINLFSALLFSFVLGLLVSLIILQVKIKALKNVIHLRNDEIKRLKFDLADKEDIKGITKKVDQIIEGKGLEIKDDQQKDIREKN